MLPSTTNIHVNSDSNDIEYIVKNMTNIDMSIKSYDIKTKKLEYSDVTSTRSSSSKDFIYVQTASGESIILTHDHKIYTTDRWVRSDRLSTGMCILNKALEFTDISEIHKINDNTSRKVYTLTVENTHCFFANDILVHNHN